MELIKEFTDITGYSIDELTSGVKDRDLILIRGIYSKLRIDLHGASFRAVASELNLTISSIVYAKNKADNYISVGYGNVVTLWNAVKPLGIAYLYEKTVNLPKSEKYESMNNTKMKMFLNTVCRKYDSDYYSYSHRKMANMRYEAKKWLEAITKATKI